jgi:hypothetical protein
MTLQPSIPLAALLAAPLAAQQFTYDAAALPAQSIWTDGVEIVDVEGDGDNDILFANGSSYSSGGSQPQHLFLNDGSGTFADASAQLNVANFNAQMVIAEDFDADGDLDLVYAPEGAYPATTQVPRMLINDGTGNFTDQSATRIPAITMASFCVCAGDVDDDGDLDVVFTDGATFSGIASQARLYLNNGSGFFTDATATLMPVDTYNAQDTILFDWENDFDIDITLSGLGGTGKRARLYTNSGTGAFAVSPVLDNLGTSNTYEIDWGDLDGDGDLDGLVQSIASGLLEGVSYNNIASVSNFTFPAPNGVDDNEMAGVDYDNDGDLDVIIGSLGSTERLYRNDGVMSWLNVNGQIQAQNDSTLDLGLGDLDNDGDVDFVTAQGESGIFTDKVYKNAGPADTQPPQVRALQTPTYGPSATVFHASTQDAIQDDGGDSFVKATYKSWQGSSSGDSHASGDAFHQGGGTWRASVPTQAGAAGAHLCWTFTDRAGNVTHAAATAGTVDDWTELGNGLAGASGVPSLVGTGSPQPGGTIHLDLSGAAPSAIGAILVNARTAYAPLLGGTVVPSPVGGAPIFVFYTTDATGSIATVSAPWPASTPDCTALYFQAVTLDAAAPAGFSFSNALAALQK